MSANVFLMIIKHKVGAQSDVDKWTNDSYCGESHLEYPENQICLNFTDQERKKKAHPPPNC